MVDVGVGGDGAVFTHSTVPGGHQGNARVSGHKVRELCLVGYPPCASQCGNYDLSQEGCFQGHMAGWWHDRA